ncbi:shikimate kinase [Saccharomonospora sp. CUA-673]|uniref:shikimate kinase n=1 Tax=Saccharomonospora sp. CUA-673 TaxID=1904969 RepID=UPI00095F82D5|nr:shikimate kinase [Saccharomonospora sp. CUA-673]OLT43637.1 shikimate kinase [Saccharomonospora sp. CUA-673]
MGQTAAAGDAAGSGGTTGPVVVVGPPGSGKTTVGLLLAERLGVPFRDADADIEAAEHRAISDIFAEDGEEVFRAIEERTIVETLAEHDGVYALGGGAILSERTRAALRGHTVVFLEVGMAEGVQRTGLSTARPLLAGVNPRATYKALLDARLPLYLEVATCRVGTDGRDPEDIAAEALNRIAPGHEPQQNPNESSQDQSSMRST